jgi:hypothetical protein
MHLQLQMLGRDINTGLDLFIETAPPLSGVFLFGALAMATLKVKPPANVITLTGTNKVVYTVDGQGFAYIPDTQQTYFVSKGWAVVTDVPSTPAYTEGNVSGKYVDDNLTALLDVNGEVASDLINSNYKSLASLDGLLAFWDFSEPRAPFYSKAGRGLFPLIQGPGSRAKKSNSGPLGHSIVFNGSTDYLYIPEAEIGELNIGLRKNEVTVLAWFKTNNSTVSHFIAGMWYEDSGDPRRQYGLFNSLPIYGGDKLVCMHISKTGGASPNIPFSRDYASNGFTNPDSVGSWIGGSYDGSNIKAYIEGRFEPYLNYTEPGAPNGQGLTYNKNPYAFADGMNSVACDFTVGAVHVQGGMGNFANGEIAALAVFDRCLSASEIADFQNRINASSSGYRSSLYRFDSAVQPVNSIGAKAYLGASAIDQSSTASGAVFQRTNVSGNGLIYRPQTTPTGISAFVTDILPPNINTSNLDSISFEMANSSTSDTVRLILKIDQLWYASDVTYSVSAASASGGDWANQEIKTLIFSKAASNWRDLTLNPNVALTLGAVRSQNLPDGNITGVGVLSPSTPAGNVRFRNIKLNTL